MLDKVKQYLQSIKSLEKRALLGLSGGPDSIFLFYALMKSGISFSVVHVDHGMREESALEAKVLEKMVREHEIPFYLEKLSPIDLDGGNIEDRLREKRYERFQKIYADIGAAILLLGHQKDDQIETVFKRILEGAGIGALGGISSISTRYGMEIHRPLLCLRKKEILEWLTEREMPYFFDKTNEDERYLRARFRKRIIPGLEKDFGKEIGSNLYRLGETMQKVWGYISKNIAPFVDRIKQEERFICLEPPFPSEPIELELLLKEMGKRAQITFSRAEIERMIDIVIKRKYGKGVVRSGWRISLEKNDLLTFNGKKNTIVSSCCRKLIE
jgi:tRNA(Ile)-lysidine synthase